MQVEFHPEASAELSEAADWYGQRSPLAARSFLVAVDLTIVNIAEDPERFARLDNRHRSCSVRKFPFQIVFRRQEDRILVVAVAHAKRRPGYWHDR